jgi:hypothetical protein
VTNSAPRISLPRLVAEGLVIVISILLAFTIDAAWDYSRERAREASYLGQLASDLENTLANNALFSERADVRDRAVAQLVRAYYAAEPPPADSVHEWWGDVGYWVVQPRLGAVQSLVTTGDLALIRDDSLRAALPNYLASMTAFERFEADGEAWFAEASRALSMHIDRVLIRIERLSDLARDSIANTNPVAPMPAGPLRELPSTDLVGAVRQPEVHRLLDQMREAQSRMRLYRERMREQSERLLDQVRQAQVDQGGGDPQ